MRYLSLLPALLLLSLPVPTAAQPLPEISNESGGPGKQPLVDRMHSGLGIRLDRYAVYFDSFFADERADERAAETQLRLISSVIKRESESYSFKQRIKARINLPQLKRHANLLIDTESDDTSSLADHIPGTRTTQSNEETNVALQFMQKFRSDLDMTHRVGLKLEDNRLNPRIQTQIRLNLQVTRRDLFRFTQSGFWEEIEGWGQETRIDYERLLHLDMPERSSLFRLTLRGLTSETSDGYEWSIPVEVLNALPGRRAYSYGASISGVTDTDTGITNTTIFARYRQSVWREWFFFDLLPQLDWPKAEGRKLTSSVKISLEILF